MAARKSPASRTARPSAAPAPGRSATKKKSAAGSRAQPLKDPEGGLTAAGRKAFARKDGSHLRPGVKGPADTPEKMLRKGSFLRRHFAHLRGPLERDGEPTRLALSAHAWGEPVPKSTAAARKLAAKGAALLDRYKKTKQKASTSPTKRPAAKKSRRKSA